MHNKLLFAPARASSLHLHLDNSWTYDNETEVINQTRRRKVEFCSVVLIAAATVIESSRIKLVVTAFCSIAPDFTFQLRHCIIPTESPDVIEAITCACVSNRALARSEMEKQWCAGGSYITRLHSRFWSVRLLRFNIYFDVLRSYHCERRQRKFLWLYNNNNHFEHLLSIEFIQQIDYT